MFSLVIAIVAIALVVAAILVGGHYGGSAISDSKAHAEATRLRTEEQQILGAVELFYADKGRYPTDIAELANTGYLTSIPRGINAAALMAPSLSVIASAFADTTTESGWVSLTPGEPVFQTSYQVPLEICAKYNMLTRGDDGILKQAYTSQASQCYGTTGDYRVVITRASSARTLLNSALPTATVQQGDLPTQAGTVFWDKLPSGEVKVATDPEKTPYAQLVLAADASVGANLGSVQVGQAGGSDTRALMNQGNIPAEGISVSVPSGFSLTSNSCPTVLAAGASCSFTVQFTPSTAGTFNAPAYVQSVNAGNFEYGLAGRAQAASADLTIAAFGQVKTGTSVIRSSTLTNTGIGPLSLSAPSVTGQGFSLAGTNCPSTLSAGSSCAVDVQLTSSGTQDFTGSLTVATAEAGTLSQPLAGTPGYSKATRTSSATFSLADWYAQGGVKKDTVTYRNDGSVPLTLSSPVLTSPLSISANTCTNVPVGADCQMEVSLDLGASGGSGSQAFTPAGAEIAPSSATATWSIYSTIATWAPSLVDFGEVLVGGSSTKTATLTNSGSVVANWTTLKNLPTDVTANASACAAVAPAGGNCQVSFTYTPTQGGGVNDSAVVPTSVSAVVGGLTLLGTGASVGNADYTTPGTYNWTVPAGVTKVSIVVVGAGGRWSGSSLVKAGAGGGALGWKNNIAVTPGQVIPVVVGTNGGASSFNSVYVAAGGGNSTDNTRGIGGVLSSPVAFDGGGNGGNGSQGFWTSQIYHGGGGGAAGYSGDGGAGSYGPGAAGYPGTGGGGAGGGGAAIGYSWGGGGVGLLGAGLSGDRNGAAGSGGSAGVYASAGSSVGGNFGGGGGGGTATSSSGAVRIIWGPGRSYPSSAN